MLHSFYKYLGIPARQLPVPLRSPDRTGLVDQANNHTILVSCSRGVAVRHSTKYLLRLLGGHSPWNNNGGIGWANGKETIQGGVNQESESYKSMMVDSAHI